ncbi:hypothetical protein NL676_037515 [Syzygium grande]|nr:hypothetical protein NL676_037515 [Syzygium grande]
MVNLLGERRNALAPRKFECLRSTPRPIFLSASQEPEGATPKTRRRGGKEEKNSGSSPFDLRHSNVPAKGLGAGDEGGDAERT